MGSKFCLAVNTRSSSTPLHESPLYPPLLLFPSRVFAFSCRRCCGCQNGGGAVGVVSWWCCGCRVVVVIVGVVCLVVLWVSCPVVVTFVSKSERIQVAGPSRMELPNQASILCTYGCMCSTTYTFERQVILTLCIHLSCVLLRLKRDFFMCDGEWVQNFASQ